MKKSQAQRYADIKDIKSKVTNMQDQLSYIASMITDNKNISEVENQEFG